MNRRNLSQNPFNEQSGIEENPQSTFNEHGRSEKNDQKPRYEMM